jgi:hypothetical protein
MLAAKCSSRYILRMRLPEVSLCNDDFLHKRVYEDADSMPQQSVLPGHFYTMRLIVNPEQEANFAADYNVRILSLYSVAENLIHQLLSKSIIKVHFIPVTDDFAPIEGAKTYPAFIDEEGTLYNQSPHVTGNRIGPKEEGIVLVEDGDLFDPWPTMDTSLPLAPVTPV